MSKENEREDAASADDREEQLKRWADGIEAIKELLEKETDPKKREMLMNILAEAQTN